MGQLYNIAVQGSAVCKSFKSLAYNMHHKTHPRDEMFVTMSLKSECCLLLVSRADDLTEDEFVDRALGAFSAEMANVLASSDPEGTSGISANQGSADGRQKKTNKLNLGGVLPGRYNMTARYNEYMYNLRGIQPAAGGPTAAETLKALRNSAAAVDATNQGPPSSALRHAEMRKDAQDGATNANAFANPAQANLAFLDSGSSQKSRMQCDQEWRYDVNVRGLPGDTALDIETYIMAAPSSNNGDVIAHHVGAGAHALLSSLVLIGPQTKFRLDQAMKSDAHCVAMFGVARDCIVSNTPVEHLVPEPGPAGVGQEMMTRGFVGRTAAARSYNKAADSTEVSEVRTAIYNAREAYSSAKMITIDLEADPTPQGFKTRRSALYSRVRCVRSAIIDFEAVVKRLLPELGFDVIEDNLVPGGHLAFVSEHNRVLLGKARQATYGVKPDRTASTVAGLQAMSQEAAFAPLMETSRANAADAAFSKAAYNRAACVNAALWWSDITGLKSADDLNGTDNARDLLMAWYRVLVLSGIAVVSDCKLSDARLELMSSQQLSQHECYVTNHLHHGFFERKTAFQEFEKGAFWTHKSGSVSYSGFSRRIMVGAWKVGSVIDSAASPIVNQIPQDYMHQSAMHSSNVFADNLNVAIEWWPGSKLSNTFGRKAHSRSQTFMQKTKIPPKPQTSFSVSMEESAYGVPS